MEDNTSMSTLVELLQMLREKGITREIRMDDSKNIILQGSDKIYNNPKELKVIRSYRFEGDTNPSDSAVLYLIKDLDDEISFIIEAYGAESNYDGPEFDDFLKAIPMSEDEFFRLN